MIGACLVSTHYNTVYYGHGLTSEQQQLLYTTSKSFFAYAINNTTSCCSRLLELFEFLLEHATAPLRPNPRFLRLLHELTLHIKNMQSN